MSENRLAKLIAKATKAVDTWQQQPSFKAWDAAMGDLADAMVEAQKRPPLPPLRKVG